MSDKPVSLRFTKRRRLQLGRQDYSDLRERVLRRDAWRCQFCGKSTNLQVHHIRHRSDLGDDSEENLVSACTSCHETLHGQR